MNRKGQALVEFVLILPLFIMLLFAIIDFGNILNQKSKLENTSTDIIEMLKNGEEESKIKETYKNLEITITKGEKYTTITISNKVDILTPGLNLVLGDPHQIEVERIIPNETTK